MYSNEKRHASGMLKPNLYFLLQAVIVLLILYLFIQAADWFKLGVVPVFVASFISIALIMYFLVRRKRVIQRQVWYSDEDEKD